MPSFRTSRRVPHTPQEMFDLVCNVEAYPQFVPLCIGLRVLRRQESEDGREVIVAEMQVGYKAIRETFTSKVTCDPENLRILVEYIDGPFRYLHNEWDFKAAPPGCLVDFAIDYEFRSRALGLLMGRMFDIAFRRFTEAFERRAAEVYGHDTHRKLS